MAKNKFYPIKDYVIIDDDIDDKPLENGLLITQEGRLILSFEDKFYFLSEKEE